MKTRFSTVLALATGCAIGAVAVQELHSASKAPVYVVTEVDISGDLGAYQTEYVPLAQASIKAAGGHLEGPSPGTRMAINAFDSVDAAQAWRNSDAFKAARKVGEKYAKFRAFAVEGLPQ